MSQCANLFAHQGTPATGERFDILLAKDNLTIERIVSSGIVEPKEYLQEQDEWVIMMQGNATVDVAGTAHELQAGDYLFLPAGTPHTVQRVTAGSLWLAVHHFKQGAGEVKAMSSGVVEPSQKGTSDDLQR